MEQDLAGRETGAGVGERGAHVPRELAGNKPVPGNNLATVFSEGFL